MFDLSRLTPELKLQILSTVTNTLIGSMSVDGQAREAQLIAQCVKELDSEGYVDPLLHPAMVMVLLANAVMDLDPNFNFQAYVAKKNAEMEA
jgi:hypothetical protein